MPSIDLNLKDLEKLVGKKLPEDLDELFMFVKGEIDSRNGDEVKLDVKETNRPDLWSTEGIARELKAKLGLEKGLPEYKVKKGKVKIIIDKNLEKVRPFIVCAVIRNVKISNDFLIQMIQLQEKIGMSFGRKRKECGLGLYDFAKMKSPVHYKGFKDKEIEFTPLEWKVKMHPSEILKEHAKGKEFGHLLEGKEFYPIVIDSAGTVASMPPIINSEATGKVTEKTKDIFLECTGFNWEIVNIGLKVMCMALADRGSEIESCEIHLPKGGIYPKEAVIHTPFFRTKKTSLELDFIHRLSGINWTDKEILSLAERCRYSAKIKGKKLELEYHDFRNDILHAVDVVEDLLIAYGFNNIQPLEVKMSTTGQERPEVLKQDIAREICIGLGLQEILQYTLTSKEMQETKMLLEEQEFVELANPVSQNYAIFRKSMIPEMLSFMAKNKTVQMPQHLFEVGKVLEIDEKQENKVRERVMLCIGISKNETNFTEIKSYLQAYAKLRGEEFKLIETSKPFMIPGRQAKILTGKKEGLIGEIHPKVLQNFGLENPVIVFELEI